MLSDTDVHQHHDPVDPALAIVAGRIIGHEPGTLPADLSQTDHPTVGESLMNLGALYRIEERYAEAEPLLQRAVAIAERVLGPDHPQTAASLSHLARLYHAQGKLTE